MKRFFFLLLTAPVFFSCEKSDCSHPTSSLAGTWKMTLVKDNISNTLFTKPSSVQNDVIISFYPNNSSAGSFAGRTPTNTFGPNAYSLNSDHGISIAGLSMTKVSETVWGSAFADNIREARQYSLEGGAKLDIITMNKTLTFQKQ